MKCAQCQAMIEDGSTLCPFCGQSPLETMHVSKSVEKKVIENNYVSKKWLFAYIDMIVRTFKIYGISSRPEFWQAFLFVFPIIFVFYFLITPILAYVWIGIHIIPFMTLLVRRLNDCGYHGRKIVLIYVIFLILLPFINFLFSLAFTVILLTTGFIGIILGFVLPLGSIIGFLALLAVSADESDLETKYS